jgi:uncharacterized membrane protein (UPF0127 family)
VAWLLREGEVLASVEVATSWRSRARGLLGRPRVEGAFVLRPCRSVHTFGMKFPLDVAFCDADMTVVRVVRMARHRAALPVWRSRTVIEAEAGSFSRWNLKPGDRLEIKGDDDEDAA